MLHRVFTFVIFLSAVRAESEAELRNRCVSADCAVEHGSTPGVRRQSDGRWGVSRCAWSLVQLQARRGYTAVHVRSPRSLFTGKKTPGGAGTHVSSLRHRGRSSTFSVDGARGESLAPAFRGPRRDSRAFSSHFHNGKRSYASCDCSSNTPSPVQGDEHFFELGGCLCTIQHVPRHPRLFKPS